MSIKSSQALVQEALKKIETLNTSEVKDLIEKKEKFNYTSKINYSGDNLVEKSQIFQNRILLNFRKKWL